MESPIDGLLPLLQHTFLCMWHRVIIYFMFCLLRHLCGSFFRYIFPGSLSSELVVLLRRCMFG